MIIEIEREEQPCGVLKGVSLVMSCVPLLRTAGDNETQGLVPTVYSMSLILCLIIPG
jgi:hypothetical protein